MVEPYYCVLGNVPMVLTSTVSPPGSHSVRIVSSSGAEDTVTYTIADSNTDSEYRDWL